MSIHSSTVQPPIYLSLSYTNYLSGLPEIPLSSIGEGRGSSLICHTDLSTCCSDVEGVWYYPNGSVIGADLGSDGLYVNREQMSVSLNYRSGAATVTAGLYCCVLPTSQGNHHYCILLGNSLYLYISATQSNITIFRLPTRCLPWSSECKYWCSGGRCGGCDSCSVSVCDHHCHNLSGTETQERKVSTDICVNVNITFFTTYAHTFSCYFQCKRIVVSNDSF